MAQDLIQCCICQNKYMDAKLQRIKCADCNPPPSLKKICKACISNAQGSCPLCEVNECCQCHTKKYTKIYDCTNCKRKLQICKSCIMQCPYCSVYYSVSVKPYKPDIQTKHEELVVKSSSHSKPDEKSDLSSVFNLISVPIAKRSHGTGKSAKLESFIEENSTSTEVEPSDVGPEVASMPLPDQLHDVSKKRVKQMILHNDVPINCGAIAVLGLPYSAKSTTLEELFRSCLIAKKAESMIRDKKDLPFKLYDVCAFGQYPFKEFKWSHTTKRFSSVYFILSDLARQCALRGFRFEGFKESNGDTESIFGDKYLDDHFNFLFGECKAIYNEYRTESSKFLEGVSLINCFDVGVSKANYDLLPLFAHCFRKLIRFVFLSLDNDGGCLSDPPNLTYPKYDQLPERHQIFMNFSRGNYLLRFAKGGYDAKTKRDAFKSTIVAWHEGRLPDDQLQDRLSDLQKSVSYNDEAIENEWIPVNPLDTSSIKKLREHVETKIKQNSHLHITMPLKWVFLRSLITYLPERTSDHSSVVKSFQTIFEFAEKLDMNREDVERFLTAFTDYASLLYCPQYSPLTEYVITDIEAFMKLLESLYHAKPEYELIRKYGIITHDVACEILGSIATIILSILESLGLAAKLSGDQVIVDGNYLSNETKPVYFMPNVRVGRVAEVHSDLLAANGSLVLHYLTTEKGENEARLSKSIFSRYPSSKVKLLASEDVNCTQLWVEVDAQTLFELHIMYHGQLSELRLANVSATEPSKITTTLSTIIEGCCKTVTDEAKSTNLNIDFKVGFKCQAGGNPAGYHYADEIVSGCIKCDCQKALKGEEGEKMREIWTMAVKKCKIPLSFNTLRRRNKELLDLKCIYKIASQLTDQLLSEEKEDELRDKLEISRDVLKGQKLKDYHGWELFVLLLTIWGKENSTGNPRKKLKDILKAVGIHDIDF